MKKTTPKRSPSQTAIKAEEYLPQIVPNTAKPDKELISIENFNQQSKKVHFTEKVTVESMNRLGYREEDVFYRPLIDFKRPGCDDSVTSLLFNKYENKRQRIIKEITEMREQVLDEIENKKRQKVERLLQLRDAASQNGERSKYIIDDMENSPFVRIELKSLNKEKQNLRNVQQQREKELKKIVMMQFIDYFQHKYHENAMLKTIERTQQIAQHKLEVLQNAHTKANQPPEDSPQLDPLRMAKREIPPLYVDKHAERLEKRKLEECKKREELKKQYELHLKTAHDRATELQEKTREDKLKKIAEDENRFKKWKEAQDQILQQQREKYNNRNQHDKNIFQNGRKREEEYKQKTLQKINESNRRAQSQAEINSNTLKNRLDSIRSRISDRSQKIQDKLTKQRQERDLYRKKLDERDQEVEAKMKKQNLDLTLKYLSRKIDRDDKAENARRIMIRQAYLTEVSQKQRHEDSRMAQQLSVEKQKVINEKSLADTHYQTRKNQLINELREMSNPDDPATRAKIAKLLNISTEEMENLIEKAKSTVTPQHAFSIVSDTKSVKSQSSKVSLKT